MKLQKMSKKEVLTHVLGRFNYLSAARSPYELKWKRFYNIYRLAIDPAERKKAMENGWSNLYIPYVYGVVETVKPRVITTMLANRPYVGMVALKQKEQPAAEAHTYLMDYQMNSKMNFVARATDAVGSALLYGTGITKQVWKLKTQKKKSRKPQMEGQATVGYKVETEEIVTYDDPQIKNIDLFDFYCDPAVQELEDQRDVIEREYIHIDTLEEMAENMGFDKSILKDLKGGGSYGNTGARERLSDIQLGIDGDTDGMIEVLWYWTDEEFAMILNREVCAVVDENPFWHCEKPYKKLVDIPVMGEFYGIGEVEPVEFLQYELNTIRNQRMDNVNLIINRMYKILRGANIDPDQLVSRPSGFIEVDTLEDIEALEMPDVSQSGYREEEITRNDIDHANGVYDYAKGASPTRRETATTAQLLTEASNERFKLKIKLMEDTWLMGVARQIAELNKQYIDQERLIALQRDIDVFEIEIKPEELNIDVEYNILGSAVDPVYNKGFKQQSLLQLFGVLSQLPFIKLPELVKKMLVAYDIRDIEKMIDVDAVKMMMIQQKVMSARGITDTLFPPQGGGTQQGPGNTMGQATAPASSPLQGGQAMGQGLPGPTPEAQMPPELMQIIASLPPQLQEIIATLPPEIQSNPEALMQLLMEIQGGGQGAQ